MRSRLLKAVIVAVEDDKEDILDELADEQASLLLQAAQVRRLSKPASLFTLLCSNMQHSLLLQEFAGHAACWCHKVYCYAPGALDDGCLLECLISQEGDLRAAGAGLVSLHVSQNIIEGGTGCHDWEAGFVLAEFLLSNPSLVQGAYSLLALVRCYSLSRSPHIRNCYTHHALPQAGDVQSWELGPGWWASACTGPAQLRCC